MNRARLKTLSSNVLAELVHSDELELIYTHLMSMQNFATVRNRLGQPGHTTGGNSGSPTAPPTDP